MFTIYQDIANDIAKTVPMKYRQMKILFLMTEDQSDQYEVYQINQITADHGVRVARAVVAFSPLFLENEAITNYINKTEQQNLRNLMPEILTIEELISFARGDITMLDQKDEKAIVILLKEMMIRFSDKPEKDTSQEATFYERVREFGLLAEEEKIKRLTTSPRMY